jgi:hypothetical protein
MGTLSPSFPRKVKIPTLTSQNQSEVGIGRLHDVGLNVDVEVQGEYEFERIRYGSNPEHLRLLATWLIEHEVEEVVMGSTAQYWKPVWGALYFRRETNERLNFRK